MSLDRVVALLTETPYAKPLTGIWMRTGALLHFLKAWKRALFTFDFIKGRTSKITQLISAKKRWLRLIAILFTVIGWSLQHANPESFPGIIFASKFEAAKTGYKTLLQKKPLTPHDKGFQEILELAFASSKYEEPVGPIETIIYTGQSYLAN